MIKIDIDFNFNILLKLFFSLSKKIIFFSSILANNNLTLKIYYEIIVIIDTNFNLNVLLQLFFSHKYLLIITYHLRFIVKIL